MTRTHGAFLLSLDLSYLVAFLAFPIDFPTCIAVMVVSAFGYSKLFNLLDLSTDRAFLGWHLYTFPIFRLPSPTARLQISHLAHPFGTWILKSPMQIVNAIAAEFICCLHPHQSHLSASWKQVCQDSSVPHHQVSTP